VCEVDLAKHVIRFTDGNRVEFDRLLSSIPLPQLGAMLRPLTDEVRAAFSELRYVSSCTVRLVVDCALPENGSVIFPEPEFPFHRVSFPGNFSESDSEGRGTILIETTYSPARPIDRTQAIEVAQRELRRIGILKPSDRIVTSETTDTEIGYVIQDHSHRSAVGLIKEFLESHGVYTIGRYGGWDNSGVEEAISHGQRLAEEIIRSEEQGMPLRSPEQLPEISIIIPVYKEEECLETYTRQILEAVDRLGIPYELILAENGGRDRTGEIADQLAKVYRQVRAVHYPEPNYGKALALGILHAVGENVVCFEIDFWDAEFVEISHVLLKKYDAVIGSKRAPGSRDRRPFIRRAITLGFNLFLKFAYGFQGTDTHGVKAFRRGKGLPVARACETGKDIFATELVLRMERAGMYICEMPLEIEEKRAPSINLAKRVPSTIRSLYTLGKVIRKLPKVDFRKMESAPKLSVGR
jgi:hypothetical protein